MKKLSKIFTSEICMWIASFFAILALIMMFVPAIDGRYVNSLADIFFNRPGADISIGIWPSFLGYMLILLALVILIIMALPFVKPTLKIEKIILIFTIIILIIGAILVILSYNLVFWMNTNLIKQLYAPLAGGYLSGIFALIASGFTIYGLKLDL